MKSKLIEEWLRAGLLPTRDFEYFTRRENLVIGKLIGKEALAEYICPHCGFYEIKQIAMIKSGKKFKRPNFTCSKCKELIRVPELRKLRD